MRHTPPKAISGDGCYLIDADGKRYLDGSGGAAVSCLGHSNAAVRAALHARSTGWPSRIRASSPPTRPSSLPSAWPPMRPPGLDRVYLVSGGSEAVEAALKLARQYFVETGQPQRHRVIARRHSYHGNTLGALAAGGKLHVGFENNLVNADRTIAASNAERVAEVVSAYRL